METEQSGTFVGNLVVDERLRCAIKNFALYTIDTYLAIPHNLLFNVLSSYLGLMFIHIRQLDINSLLICFEVIKNV